MVADLFLKPKHLRRRFSTLKLQPQPPNTGQRMTAAFQIENCSLAGQDVVYHVEFANSTVAATQQLSAAPDSGTLRSRGDQKRGQITVSLSPKGGRLLPDGHSGELGTVLLWHASVVRGTKLSRRQRFEDAVEQTGALLEVKRLLLVR